MRQSQKIIIVGCIGIIIVLIIMRRKSTDNNSVNNSVNNPVNNNEEPIRPPGYKPIDEEPVVPTPVIPPPPPPPPPRPNCSGGQVLNESSNTCICPDPLQSWNGQCNCPGRHPVSGVGMIVDNGTKMHMPETRIIVEAFATARLVLKKSVGNVALPVVRECRLVTAKSYRTASVYVPPV